MYVQIQKPNLGGLLELEGGRGVLMHMFCTTKRCKTMQTTTLIDIGYSTMQLTLMSDTDSSVTLSSSTKREYFRIYRPV